MKNHADALIFHKGELVRLAIMCRKRLKSESQMGNRIRGFLIALPKEVGNAPSCKKAPAWRLA